MSKYAPTTGEVRRRYAYARSGKPGHKNQGAVAEFDRWLAAHDAEVTAKALERGVDELGVYVGDEDGDYWTGYRGGQRRQIHVLKKLAVESRAATIRTTNNEDASGGHDLDRMGICTRCGHGITARELLDGDEQCTTNNESEGKA